MSINKKKFDYIICGGGASGLSLALKMCNDNYFNNNSILLIEKDKKDINDRTWCFWEQGEGDYEEIICNKWNDGEFKAQDYKLDFSFDPFKYKMVKSKDFYSFIQKKLKPYPQLNQVREKVLKIDPKLNLVTTNKKSYEGGKIFSSIYDPEILKTQKKFPVLIQHFVGCIVETKNQCFDSGKIGFMNFDLPQKNETRFVYVLPESSKKALIEYTLFSKILLPEEEYLNEIKNYLKSINTGGYKILEKEKGQIPMTCFRFDNLNTDNLLYIGTAGGWTKASTGYTFSRINEKTKQLISYIKKEKPLSKFNTVTRFWFYDLIFLDVLSKNNSIGSKLFKKMFQKNKPEIIFKFLDDKSNFWQELKIISSFPFFLFITAFFKRIFKLK